LALAGAGHAQEVEANLREGIYTDTDRTEVIRSLAAVDAAWSGWRVSAHESVDVVTSASMDVRTSPALDSVSSPSGVSMSDRRFETTVGVSYDDGGGHIGGLSLVHATERDYTSVGAGLTGSWDLAERNTTLFGGVNFNYNWVSSIIDPSFARTLASVSYTAGIAQVLGPSDAVRLRYDGTYLDGYQASPYRNVRFGDWTTTRSREAITFTNTIGSPDGMPELEPETRVRHAVVAEWLHAIGDDVGLSSSVRLARDSWGILAATLGADVRAVVGDWQLRVGYRFYIQGAADFFADKYTSASDTYAYYTSDKELGAERGHIGTLDVNYVAKDWPSGGMTTQIDVMLDGLHYDYPGFALLPSRDSVFAQVGVRLKF
jgi:hypothetical protein